MGYSNADGRWFTTEELRTVADIMGWEGEELADNVAGMNCDEYADDSCEVMYDIFHSVAENGGYEEGDTTGHWEHTLYCMHDHLSGLEPCELWHRALNIRLDNDEDIREAWKRDNIGTLVYMLEEGRLDSALEHMFYCEETDSYPPAELMRRVYKEQNNLS